MRSFPMLVLSLVMVSACSQNPHLEVSDPPPAATQAAAKLEPDLGLTPVMDTSSNDIDQDGVLNEMDKCPTVKGPAENNGCPWDKVMDTDQDGTLNTDDRCPQEQGPTENEGCPYPGVGDMDKDGTLDGQDRCRMEPGPRENQGCPYPDQDGDGVLDPNDKCPTVSGDLRYEGCPAPKGVSDADKDGIADDEDECPRVPGPKSNRGCPYPRVEEKLVLESVMGSLKFDLDEAVIKPESYPALKRLVAFLKKYPRARLKLVGHTDDQADDDYNQELSERRVAAVKDYLMQKGVSHYRIHAEARGESEPLVDIEDLRGDLLEQARALNRRVDMSVSYLER